MELFWNILHIIGIVVLSIIVFDFLIVIWAFYKIGWVKGFRKLYHPEGDSNE